MREYWLFDPTGDWLNPRLQGHRLSGGEFVEVAPAGIEGGERVLRSAVLGLDVFVDGGEIRFRDPVTGRKLLNLEETELALREAERAREAADLALKEARARIAELEGKSPAEPSRPPRRR